jgi:hypothetical protein
VGAAILFHFGTALKSNDLCAEPAHAKYRERASLLHI